MYFSVIFLVAVIGLLQDVTAQTVDATQLQGWQNFYDKTGGASWKSCNGKRTQPCSCTGTTNALVTCTTQGDTQFITAITLRNNNLVGFNVPGTELESILGATDQFTTLDLTGNTKLLNNKGGCIRIPSCSNPGVLCQLDYQVCPASATSVPSASGSVTPSGESTSSPSVTSATVAPSTNSSETAAPSSVTGSPSTLATQSPSTFTPSTQANVTSTPTSSNSTSTPSTQANVTSTPTSPTSSNSTSTGTPTTPKTTTKSPNSVSVTTPSPTSSAIHRNIAGAFLGMVVGAAVLLLA